MRLRDAAWSLLERMNARMDQSTEGSHTQKKQRGIYFLEKSGIFAGAVGSEMNSFCIGCIQLSSSQHAPMAAKPGCSLERSIGIGVHGTLV